MSAKPASDQPVTGSPRITAPATSATAGLTYVTAVARTGPVSVTRAAIMVRAAALHTTPSTITLMITDGDGQRSGQLCVSVTAGA